MLPDLGKAGSITERHGKSVTPLPYLGGAWICLPSSAADPFSKPEATLGERITEERREQSTIWRVSIHRVPLPAPPCLAPFFLG